MRCPHGERAKRRCRLCTNAYMAVYMHAYRRRSPRWPTAPAHAWLQAAILSHLAEAPEPVGTRDLLEHTGCADASSLRVAIHRARRAGHPIVTIRLGRTGRYRLEAS